MHILCDLIFNEMQLLLGQCHESTSQCCLIRNMKAELPFVNHSLLHKTVFISISKTIQCHEWSQPEHYFSSIKHLSGHVHVAPLVLLRQAAWWPDCGADYRWQGHCWPEGPGNVGMAMWKGHHHSTVSIITVTQWGKSCRKQDLRTSWAFFHIISLQIQIYPHAYNPYNLLQVKQQD